MRNFGDDDFSVEKHMKIAQIIIVKIANPEVCTKNELDDTERGTKGCGSTGAVASRISRSAAQGIATPSETQVSAVERIMPLMKENETTCEFDYGIPRRSEINDDDDIIIPSLPCFSGNKSKRKHRQKINERLFSAISALVARPVGKKEIDSSPAAQAALQKEWGRLQKNITWDLNGVREWAQVAQEARAKGVKVHMGYVFQICVEKGSELDPSDPNRKYEGRVVFRGNQVKDENWDNAMFSELSSSPATMQAAKACDCYGISKGNAIEVADAEQVYTQANLEGTKTWVRLSRERWPASWAGMKNPVCPLLLALYGHPDSGGYWEHHCDKHLKAQGFKPIKDWYSCYWHDQLKLFLVVYVDNFEMSGPAANLSKGWDLIKNASGAHSKGIKIEKPAYVDRYLGCHQRISDAWVDENGSLMLESAA